MRDDHTAAATIEGRPTASDGAPPDGAPPDGAPPDERDGARAALTGERYRVASRLGKGGMGEVMLVRDEIVGREVALKRIRRAEPSERLVQRFLREASIQGRLEHPAIVPLYDIGRDARGQPFFTMKKLTGRTLSKILAGDRREHSLQRLLRAFTEVCLAIELAHTRGIIHRDLKPDNIVLGDFGEVYVLDWGVAKVSGDPDGDFADVRRGATEAPDELATVPGSHIGTAGYMAPEQIQGLADLDARADVYALGCILFEIVAHQMLHPAGAAGIASARAGHEERPSERAPDRAIPPELDELCLHATRADRAQRIATARELGEAVQRFLDGDRDLALRRQLAREHLAVAQAAFASTETADQRRLAMREAASALALDPSLGEAAELVGRLMLEPPRTTPPEVEQSMLDEDVQTMRDNARVALWGYLGFLAFMPLLWWMAPAGTPYLPVLLGLVGINLAVCWRGARGNPLGIEGWLAVTNALLLVAVSRGFTPFLIAPSLAAMSVMGVVFSPTRAWFTSALGMGLITTLAVLGPWLLERVGALSLTTTVDEHGILLAAPGIAGDESRTLIVAVLYVILLIASAAGLARGMRARERAAQRHLHLQAWQLRQLVPR